ncbi:MAG: hypothetical protein HY928_05440 [Elusimicrobia bacterium]|nr:hypothetical protein [Elusimicrobiota bacterium]
MRALAASLLLFAAAEASAAGPCGALMTPQRAAAAKASEDLPPLSEVRDAVLAAAQEAGRSDVSCDEVQNRGDREALQCYNGNQVALLGQMLRIVDGQPLLAASLGDSKRVITKQGVLFDGTRMMPHMGGSPGTSVLRARQLFCESVVSGKAGTLVLPVSGSGADSPKAVPAIYHPDPAESGPRVYKI